MTISTSVERRRARARLARLLTRLCSAAAIAAVLQSPGLAQSSPTPPPRQDTETATGVSYHRGGFSYREHDLSIGAGQFPQALSLDRSYLSSLDSPYSGYAGYYTIGWTDNLTVRFSNSIIKNEFMTEPAGTESYLYSIVIGARSVGFLGGSSPPTGGFVGTYETAQIGGEALTFTGQQTTGYFTFTDADGSILTFDQSATGLLLTSWLAPDGTKLTFSYSGNVRTIISNRGYAIIKELADVPGGHAVVKACAVNLAGQYITATSTCPTGAQSVTYTYSASSAGPVLIASTDTVGQMTQYSYEARGHLSCIKQPGQSGCSISNTYGVCHRDPALLYDPDGLALNDPVIQQVTATGETYAYSFSPTPQCPVEGHAGGGASVTVAGGTHTVVTNNAGLPTSVTNALGRSTSMTYDGKSNALLQGGTVLTELDQPEGNKLKLTYDERGNVLERREVAKPGSQSADIVTSATFAETCENAKVCNKPSSTTDARGRTINYSYDPTHGGVLSEMQPAPSIGAARPLKLFSYVQKTAYVKNASGALVAASSPVWLLATEAQCQTVAGSSTASCNPVAPQILTTYEYGADGTADNLLLRGRVVTANGTSLRTCYRYDDRGNKVAETSSRAGLPSCPAQ